MAYVASSDRHGNEIMRVMLCTEQPTVASCHNLHINCNPQRRELRHGHFDNYQRFNYNANHSNGNLNRLPKIDMAQIKVLKPQPYIGWHMKENVNKWSKDEVNAHSTLLSTVTSVAKDSNNSKSKESTEPPTSLITFCSWLTAKKEAQQRLLEQRRLNVQAETERAKERASLAQVEYDNWLAEKTKQEQQRIKTESRSKELSKRNSPITASSSRLCTEESFNRLYEWERKKLIELRRQREERASRESFKESVDKQRRELGEEVWQQWVQTSHNKPKPVPMGQGLDSLRGTISPHYLNPNEWQPLSKHDAKASTPQEQPKIKQRMGPDYERLDRLAQPKRKLWLQTFQQPIKLQTKPYMESVKMDRSQSTQALSKQSKIGLKQSKYDSPSVTWRSCICLSQDGRNDAPQHKLEQTNEDKSQLEIVQNRNSMLQMEKSALKPLDKDYLKSKPARELRKVNKQIPWR